MVVYDGNWEVDEKKTITKNKGKVILVDKYKEKKEKTAKGIWEPGKPGRPPNWYKYGLVWNGE